MTDTTRKLATIVALDVAGYSARTEADEARTTAEVAALRKVIDAIAAKHGGRVFNTAGDGFMLEFGSSLAAVEAAFELAESCEPKVRVGVHLGDVVVQPNGDLLGHGVNVAARLMAQSKPGAVLVSADVQRSIRGPLAQSLHSRGTVRLAKMSEAIEVFSLDPGESTRRSVKARLRNAWARRKDYLTPRSAAIAGALVLALVLLIGWLWRGNPQGTVTASSGQIRSLAVLPLDNYSGDPAQEFFVDGMTDELTTNLAGISSLRVISRSSVMQFKGAQRPPTQQIGNVLNVDAVVEGSVIRIGEKVRITVQLIDARMDKHLWAQTFQRSSGDVFALQDELTAAIAGQIKVQLTPVEQKRLTTARAVNPKAHEAYLMGRYLVNRTDDENEMNAVAKFEEAIRLDPGFAPAYAGLSDAYEWLGTNEGAVSAIEARDKAKQAAEKAVALDDGSAEAHAALAQNLVFLDYDFAAAEVEFRRAFELNPNYAYALDQYGLALYQMGRFSESEAMIRRAIELDPLAPQARSDLGLALVGQGQFDLARAQADKIAELAPGLFLSEQLMGWIADHQKKFGDAIVHYQNAIKLGAPSYEYAFLGYAYGMTGDRTRALAQIEALKKVSPHGVVPPFSRAMIHMGIGEQDLALEELYEAYKANSQLIMLLNEPMWDPLRSNPRFVALLKKLGLPLRTAR